MRVRFLTTVAIATFCQAEAAAAETLAPLVFAAQASGPQMPPPPVTATQVGGSETPAPSGPQAAPPPATVPILVSAQSGPVGVGAQDPRFTSSTPRVQTLQQALAQTYQTSPTLMAQRAQLRGLDNDVALARAAGRPQIGINANINQEAFVTRPIGTTGRSLSANAQVDQVLFAGGSIRNSVRAADTRVIAGRADLRATEGDVFTEAVGAYADLIRDREISDLNLNQVLILEVNLDATRGRFRVRDLTLTDVSQSEARLAVARSSLATAEANLESSEENFERVIGARAGLLEALPPLPPLPSTADQAVEIALQDNADVASLVSRARAAGYDVDARKGERLPTISATGSAAYDNALGTADEAAGVPKGTLRNSLTNVGAGFSLRLPLYQGGAASARVRQAEETRAELVERATAAERLAVAGTRAAFARWRAAMTTIRSNESAVAANAQAVESVKIEQSVGARSILDVLNAEQELLSSRIALASARREAYVAAFELLNTMGAAEAADLNFDVGPLYDPGAHYRTYANTWSDGADGPRNAPASTRTVPDQVDSPLTRLLADQPTASERRP